MSEVTKAIVKYIQERIRPQFFNYFTNKWSLRQEIWEVAKEKEPQGFGENL